MILLFVKKYKKLSLVVSLITVNCWIFKKWFKKKKKKYLCYIYNKIKESIYIKYFIKTFFKIGNERLKKKHFLS